MLVKSKIIYKKNILVIINILSTSNNTIMNFSYAYKNTIFCGSGGFFGMRGSRRSTSYAAQLLGSIIKKKLTFLKIKYLYIKLKGFGKGRNSSVKSLVSKKNFKILNILDCTPVLFNGCKPSKKRRV